MQTRGSCRMFPSRSRDSSMLTSTREPSQSYHVAAVCGEPSLRSVAITGGFGLRNMPAGSGGSGGLGIALSFLAPVALESEEGLVNGRGLLVVRSDVLVLCRAQIPLRRLDELVLFHPVPHTLRPYRETLARFGDVRGDLLGALDDAVVDQRQPRGLMEEHRVERPLPGFDVDVRRGRLPQHMRARHAAHPSCIAL